MLPMPASESARPGPSPLQLEIANRVIAMIHNGSLVAGQHLTEQALTDQFGVSRSPVRGALRLLEAQGFVQSRANAGVFIADGGAELPLTALASSVITTDELYRTIIADRARGILGDTLTEVELLDRYSVPKGILSRTLLRMANEGLLERAKGHGWRFPPGLDSKEAKYESYRLRMLLECHGLREPGFRFDREKMTALRRRHEHFLILEPAAQTPHAFYDLNADFHETLARLSGNRFIFQAVRQQNQLRRFEETQHYIGRPLELCASCREHMEIMDALDAGDIEWAGMLLHRHLDLASKA